MPVSRPLPSVIGPAENALRALLTKTLSTTAIKTYPGWVCLNALSKASVTPSNGNWRLAVADALKVELGEVEGVLDQLRATGLVGNDDMPTALGETELAKGRSTVSRATSCLVEGIGEEEQETVRQVLDQIRRKAEELLRT
ncbi:hypothetical protein [Rhodoferax sp. GW822-FHT02A01]|uniref:hypothetical protein n=1 Tax=Rhodoferax sp. GW822-FHT02A01 TaxID=3141537 RepID=UPI00315C61A9